MSILETAKDIGQGIYTKEEVDSKVEIVVSTRFTGSVSGGDTNKIYSYIVQKPGIYSVQYFYTPHSDSGATAPVVYNNFRASYAYGAIYNGTAIVGTKYFEVGDEIYFTMYGGNNQSWSMHSSNLTITKIG